MDLIFTIVSIITSSIRSILIPLIINNCPTPYSIPLVVAPLSALQFFIISTISRSCTKKIDKCETNRHLSFIFIGLLDSLVGIFAMYSSDPKRLPIATRIILDGSSIYASIVLSMIFIKKEKRYIHPLTILSLILLLCSIILIVIPTFIHSTWSYMSIIWILLYFMSRLFRGAFATAQEKYIEVYVNPDINIAEENTIPKRIIKFNILTDLVFWSSFYQSFIFMSFFWIDLIPFVGYSRVELFFENFIGFFTNPLVVILTLIYVILGTGFYLSNVYLCAKSSTYTILVGSISPIIVIIFYEIVPMGLIQFPFYFTIPAIILNIFSVVLWKIWEHGN